MQLYSFTKINSAVHWLAHVKIQTDRHTHRYGEAGCHVRRDRHNEAGCHVRREKHSEAGCHVRRERHGEAGYHVRRERYGEAGCHVRRDMHGETKYCILSTSHCQGAKNLEHRNCYDKILFKFII